MRLAILKFMDMAFRSLFLLLPLYFLSAEKSGQFGLIVTIVAFYCFFCGFERYLDLQRKLVGKTTEESERDILGVIRFYALNLLFLSPVLIVVLLFWVKLSYFQVSLILVIVVGEHFANEIYRLSLIVGYLRPWFLMVVVKNFILLSAVVVIAIVDVQSISLDAILIAWAIVSTAFVSISAIRYRLRVRNLDLQKLSPWIEDMRAQFLKSATHFWIGLTALLTLQGDRLIVGGLLSLEQTGIYYRHVVIATVAYQAVSIISHNRILFRVYEGIRLGDFASVRKTIFTERLLLVVTGLLVVIAISMLNLEHDYGIKALQTFMPYVLAGLIAALIVRALADYNAILLNAAHREKDIFVCQSISLLLAATFNLFLILKYSLPGTVISVLLGAFIYLVTTSFYVRKRAIIPKTELQAKIT